MQYVLALVLCLLVAPGSAMELFGDDDGSDGGGLGEVTLEREPTPEPGEAAPPDAPAPAPASVVSNSAFLGAVHSFAAERRLALAPHGQGHFRLLLVAGAQAPDIPELLQLGDRALEGLEAWTGRQGWFREARLSDELVNWLIIIPEREFDAFIDWYRARGAQRPEGEDLTKKLKTSGGDRCVLIGAAKFNQNGMPPHWAINSSAAIALRTFFAQRGRNTMPPWISEGLKAQLEIMLSTSKVPRITAIAYEDNNVSTAGSGSWARDVADLIRSRDRALITAGNVMDLDLIGLGSANYKQMWSYCQFIRESCGMARGERNRFGQLLTLLAAGKDGRSAVAEVLNLSDPALSRSWVAWASKQR